MKIRTKSQTVNNELKYTYEIDDEKGTKMEIDALYIDAAIKVLKIAGKKISIRNAKAFEKFILNLKMSTKYYDKQIEKEISAPNFLHKNYETKDIEEYKKRSIKYDRKAQFLFFTHNAWYDNLSQILQEIKTIIDENYEYIDNEANLLYIANRIDSVLNNYRRKPKVKTL